MFIKLPKQLFQGRDVWVNTTTILSVEFSNKFLTIRMVDGKWQSSQCRDVGDEKLAQDTIKTILEGNDDD